MASTSGFGMDFVHLLQDSIAKFHGTLARCFLRLLLTLDSTVRARMQPLLHTALDRPHSTTAMITNHRQESIQEDRQ
jgi:hypothetical protein